MTVVIPVYNCERYVKESIESVLAQTYRELEVVIVDDASTDGSVVAVESAVDGERVRCIRNERNLGQFGAVNVGIGHARGELIAVHHADDVMFPNRLERQVDWLREHPEAGSVFAMDVYIDPDGREFGRTSLIPELRGRDVFGYSDVLNAVLRHGNIFLRAPTNLVRAALYREVGPYSEEWALRGDIEMWLRLARAAPIGILDEALVAYRWGHANESAQYERRRTEPELTFALLDDALDADLGLAEPGSLRGFEARRAADLVTVSLNRYLSTNRDSARQALAGARLRSILRTGRAWPIRLLVLWSALHVLVRVPRISLLTRSLERRYGRSPREGQT